MKIIHIFGCPNAGKTVLRNALVERHPEMWSCGIDEFRRDYSDGTPEGEYEAQIRFVEAMKNGGFFECSGAGRFVGSYLRDNRQHEQYIIVLDIPSDVCLSRLDERKYDDIPFPFKVEEGDFTAEIERYLSSDEFERVCAGIPTLRLKETSLDEQVRKVESFTGI